MEKRQVNVRFLFRVLLTLTILMALGSVAMAGWCPPEHGHHHHGEHSVPEIGATALGPVLAAIGGGILILVARRRKSRRP